MTAQGNSYPAELLQDDGRPVSGIVGITFTDNNDQPGSGGGGGGIPYQTGTDNPVNTVTPVAAGALYRQTSVGALWYATDATASGWVLVTGIFSSPPGVGALAIPANLTSLVAASGAANTSAAFAQISMDDTAVVQGGATSVGGASANVVGGAATTGDTNGGDVNLQSGPPSGDGNSGNITLLAAGTAGGGDGGSVRLQPGGTNTGANGTVQLRDFSGQPQVTVDLGSVFMPNLPTSDPHVAGQLYAVAGAVMVSAG